MTTPHISAEPGAFAPLVIMPDDPVQARYIADTFLESSREITTIRNMLGYTGTYKDIPVSVMGGGLGIPSVSIYTKELFVDYGVETIISVGECYALHKRLSVRDIVLAQGASTFSGVNRARFAGGDFAAIGDFELLRQAWHCADEKKLPARIGNICTVDTLYGDADESDLNERVRGMLHMGILGTDMNTAGLYGVAAECGRKALAVCYVSEHIQSSRALSSDDKGNSFRHAMQVVLGAIELSDGGERKCL